jgi:hypothetical protein
MNTLLNLEELIYSNTKSNKAKEENFNDILNRCHKIINFYNKNYKKKSCYYKIPVFIFGKPLYNINELALFLYKNLTNNGLFVSYIPEENKLYISWEEDKINYNLYVKNKNMKLHTPLQSVIQQPSQFNQPVKNKSAVKFKDENVLLFDGIPVNKEKYNQAQFINKEREKYYKNLIESKAREGFDQFKSSSRGPGDFS